MAPETFRPFVDLTKRDTPPREPEHCTCADIDGKFLMEVDEGGVSLVHESCSRPFADTDEAPGARRTGRRGPSPV